MNKQDPHVFQRCQDDAELNVGSYLIRHRLTQRFHQVTAAVFLRYPRLIQKGLQFSPLLMIEYRYFKTPAKCFSFIRVPSVVKVSALLKLASVTCAQAVRNSTYP